MLVPASSVWAQSEEFLEQKSSVAVKTDKVPGDGLDDQPTTVANTDAGSKEEPSATGELLINRGGLVATEYQGNRVTLSSSQDTSLSWTGLGEDELVAARTLVGDDNANGKRAASSAPGVDYLTLVSSDGFSVLIEAASVEAGSEYAFDVGLPNGASLILTDDGSVDVLGNDRYTIGTFEAPWALDANGKKLPTRFKVKGDTITQVVDIDETTAYPVVADPRFTWGWVSGTVYFNKAETESLCLGAIAALSGMSLRAIWVPILYAIAGTIAAFSCTAHWVGMCIKVKSYHVVIAYSGGYCTE